MLRCLPLLAGRSGRVVGLKAVHAAAGGRPASAMLVMCVMHRFVAVPRLVLATYARLALH